MQWKIDSGAPIYAQLVEQLKLRIITEVFPLGSRMPAVRELAMEAGVNPNTMQRALQELERQGMVFAQRTSGRFVTEDREVVQAAREKLAQNNISTFLSQMSLLGYSREELAEMLKREEYDSL